MALIKSTSRYKLLKVSLVFASIVIVSLFVVHLWFTHNARKVLTQYIAEQSKGNIQLSLSELDLNLFTKRLKINDAVLMSTDSVNSPITYNVSFSQLSLKVASIWELLINNELFLDSVKLYNPVIKVYQWRKDTTAVVSTDELSIPQELGKMYNSMNDALDAFAIRRIVIDNGEISLVDKINDTEPSTVSNIFFDLARTPAGEGKKRIFNKEQQTIELKIGRQQIALPGGRHHISFKSFNLQLLRQAIILDSCTLTAKATDSVKSNYTIFFKKLHFTGVDFAALSTKDIIKADSVLCENPMFNFNLYSSDAVEKKSELPDPDKIIKELSGNLDLAYVEVKNAGINFEVHGKTKQSFYNSNKDNFQIKNFRINPDSATTVSIGSFDMTLRDYQLFNADSSSIYSFDSLHFFDNRVILNNFSMLSKPGIKLRNFIDVKVPYFELTKLDWYRLIFNQEMVAKEAILINPIINYSRRIATNTGKKLDLFDALLNLDSMVSLENIAITNGQVNMQFGAATSFGVQNIDLKIQSDKLLHSTNKEGLRNAVEKLSFSKGILRTKDLTAELKNARLTGENLVYADQVILSGLQNNIKASINNVYLDNVQLDDAEEITVDGLRWETANVFIQAIPSVNKKSNANGTNIIINNFSGNNTRLKVAVGSSVISTFIKSLNASSLYKKGNEPIRVNGFTMAGKEFLFENQNLNLSAAEYNLSDNQSSSLATVRLKQIKGRDSLIVSSSYIKLQTRLNDLISNNLHLQSVQANDLVVVLNKWDTTTTAEGNDQLQNIIRIDHFTAPEPDITITTHRNDSLSIINIPWSEKSLVKASDIFLSPKEMKIGDLSIHTTAATYLKPTGELLGIEKGKIEMDLSNISFATKNGKMIWGGAVNLISLQNPKGLGMGGKNNNFLFENASLGNLNLSSEYLPDFGQLFKANLSAWLHIPEGKYIDNNRTIKWHNARFDNGNRTLSLDSFSYHPTPSLDSALARALYRFDYMTLKTGAMQIIGLDLAQYEKDSSFIANEIKISNPVFTVYTDLKLPLTSLRKEKPLLVNIIKNIDLPVSVNTIKIDSGTITYSEKNAGSREEGDLLFSNVNATIANIKNRNLIQDDSLSLTVKARLMDAAEINLNLHQSYTDSLSGFVLNTKISGTDLAVLNPFLVPAANVKIDKGILDSMSFTVVGRDDLALGEMQLHYHDLRLKFVKDGDPDHSTFFQKILSFAANTFILKNKNSSRMGVMFAEHEIESSFINYIVKMTLSGISTSVGFKKNRKLMKQYNKAIEKSENVEIVL